MVCTFVRTQHNCQRLLNQCPELAAVITPEATRGAISQQMSTWVLISCFHSRPVWSWSVCITVIVQVWGCSPAVFHGVCLRYSQLRENCKQFEAAKSGKFLQVPSRWVFWSQSSQKCLQILLFWRLVQGFCCHEGNKSLTMKNEPKSVNVCRPQEVDLGVRRPRITAVTEFNNELKKTVWKTPPARRKSFEPLAVWQESERMWLINELKSWHQPHTGGDKNTLRQSVPNIGFALRSWGNNFTFIYCKQLFCIDLSGSSHIQVNTVNNFLRFQTTEL